MLVVLENYEKQRGELLQLVRNHGALHAQRVEAVRVLGEMIRGNDEEVVSLLLASATKEPHPIMRALAIKSLRDIVGESWGPTLRSLCGWRCDDGMSVGRLLLTPSMDFDTLRV